MPLIVTTAPATPYAASVVIGILRHWYFVNLVLQTPPEMPLNYTTTKTLFEFSDFRRRFHQLRPALMRHPLASVFCDIGIL